VRLEFDPAKSEQYPHGYWLATTNDGDYDADGVTPLEAITTLALTLEQTVYAMREKAKREGSG
jgi:hypothetical protein